jgi:hypothetical protein
MGVTGGDPLEPRSGMTQTLSSWIVGNTSYGSIPEVDPSGSQFISCKGL